MRNPTITFPTTLTVAMLVRNATGEVLREALPLEVAAAKASGYAWLPYNLLTRDGMIPCFVEYVTRPMTDAEYNHMLVEIEA